MVLFGGGGLSLFLRGRGFGFGLSSLGSAVRGFGVQGWEESWIARPWFWALSL